MRLECWSVVQCFGLLCTGGTVADGVRSEGALLFCGDLGNRLEALDWERDDLYKRLESGSFQ